VDEIAFKDDLDSDCERGNTGCRVMRYLYGVVMAVHAVEALGVLVPKVALREDVSENASR